MPRHASWWLLSLTPLLFIISWLICAFHYHAILLTLFFFATLCFDCHAIFASFLLFIFFSFHFFDYFHFFIIFIIFAICFSLISFSFHYFSSFWWWYFRLLFSLTLLLLITYHDISFHFFWLIFIITFRFIIFFHYFHYFIISLRFYAVFAIFIAFRHFAISFSAAIDYAMLSFTLRRLPHYFTLLFISFRCHFHFSIIAAMSAAPFSYFIIYAILLLFSHHFSPPLIITPLLFRQLPLAISLTPFSLRHSIIDAAIYFAWHYWCRLFHYAITPHAPLFSFHFRWYFDDIISPLIISFSFSLSLFSPLRDFRQPPFSFAISLFSLRYFHYSFSYFPIYYYFAISLMRCHFSPFSYFAILILFTPLFSPLFAIISRSFSLFADITPFHAAASSLFTPLFHFRFHYADAIIFPAMPPMPPPCHYLFSLRRRSMPFSPWLFSPLFSLLSSTALSRRHHAAAYAISPSADYFHMPTLFSPMPYFELSSIIAVFISLPHLLFIFISADIFAFIFSADAIFIFFELILRRCRHWYIRRLFRFHFLSWYYFISLFYFISFSLMLYYAIFAYLFYYFIHFRFAFHLFSSLSSLSFHYADADAIYAFISFELIFIFIYISLIFASLTDDAITPLSLLSCHLFFFHYISMLPFSFIFIIIYYILPLLFSLFFAFIDYFFRLFSSFLSFMTLLFISFHRYWLLIYFLSFLFIITLFSFFHYCYITLPYFHCLHFSYSFRHFIFRHYLLFFTYWFSCQLAIFIFITIIFSPFHFHYLFFCHLCRWCRLLFCHFAYYWCWYGYSADLRHYYYGHYAYIYFRLFIIFFH